MIFSALNGIGTVVTQAFGLNPAAYSKYGLNGHNGTDCRCTVGTPLYAPCEGYLHYADEGTVGYGKYAMITSLPYAKDGTGRQITLGHLSKFVGGLEGQFIHMGDLVGYSGASGDATGPHLHITYKKIDAQGNVVNYSNGFHGAIDIQQFIQEYVVGQHL